MKRVIIVAPHFPPSALPPALRVRSLVQHLHQFGYEPVIVTTKHKFREEIADAWMVESAGSHFRKIEIPAVPAKWTRLFGVGDLG